MLDSGINQVKFLRTLQQLRETSTAIAMDFSAGQKMQVIRVRSGLYR